MGRVKIIVDGYLCVRCKHEWIPRSKKTINPIICPHCKSPYWDIPKKRKKKSQG